MAQKPEIQYVGQFYIHGSEAKALELKQKKEQKQAKTELPQHRFQRVRKIHVDLLAVSSMVMAMVFLVTMVGGILAIQTDWQELETAQQYVFELQAVNRELNAQFRSSFDIEQVRSAALAMGLVPEAEAATMKLHVTMPKAEPERSQWDDFVWFLQGLFAE